MLNPEGILNSVQNPFRVGFILASNKINPESSSGSVTLKQVQGNRKKTSARAPNKRKYGEETKEQYMD